MTITIKDLDEVWTTDSYKLGMARCLHYRPEEQINPDEQLYAVYLEVENFELGDDFYIPLMYVLGRDEENGHILLSTSMKQVLNRTWSRMPDFVAKMEGRKECLPAAEEDTAKPDPV
jgi:hypothetical protein